MSPSVRSEETGDNATGQAKDRVYEGFVFESKDTDKETRRHTGKNERRFSVKTRHLVICEAIRLIIVISLIAVSGLVVYNMSKCQECQQLESAETRHQIDQTDLYATYIRWGRTTCSNESSTLYTGYASGSHFQHQGGSSNTICLPEDPQFGKSYPGENNFAFIYNAEYEVSEQTQAIFGEDMDDQDVPCAVCEVKGRSAILMIPARMECYDGWIKEYSGYLMTEQYGHHRSNMKCVDENPEKIRGQSGNNDGEVLYFVEVRGTIPDPPYTRGVELTCVVCSK